MNLETLRFYVVHYVHGGKYYEPVCHVSHILNCKPSCSERACYDCYVATMLEFSLPRNNRQPGSMFVFLHIQQFVCFVSTH